MSAILVADDESIYPMIITEHLGEDGHHVDIAEDGEEAWAMMQKNSYDLLILDRMMPKLDGLSLLRRAKADPKWKSIPVILQTAAARQEQVAEGIEAGAYYYLIKPYEPRILRTLVRTILGDIEERVRLREAGGHLQTALNLLTEGEMAFRTLGQAHSLAAACASVCRHPTAVGRGLFELLVNAVEHGNLGITYADKSRLLLEGEWEQEVGRRLAQAPWCERQASLSLRRQGGNIQFTVRDQGAGFDWTPYLEISPERAFDLHGRGIAMANKLGFDSLAYQGNGNTVVAQAAAGPEEKG